MKKSLLSAFAALALFGCNTNEIGLNSVAAHEMHVTHKKTLPFTEMVAWINHGAPLFTRELQQDIHRADAAPFNAFSIATLGPTCATQGAIIFQTASGLSKCLTGTNGQFLQSQGPGADLRFFTSAGLGTVTSVAMTVPADESVSGSPITGAGTLAVTRNSQLANLFLASPNGSSGTPTYRSIVSADIPALAITAAQIANGAITTTQINAGAGILGSQLSASAAIVGTQLSASANIAGSQVVSSPTFGGTVTASFFSGNGASLTAIAGANITTNTVPLSALVQGAAATLDGNPTASTANKTAFTIAGLTDIVTPNISLDPILIFDHVAGTLKKTFANELIPGGTGVSSFNSRTGAVVPANADYATNQLTTNVSGTLPSAGKIGETITNTGAGTGLTTNVAANIAQVPLTAGDWDCFSSLVDDLSIGTSYTESDTGMGTTSATIGSFPVALNSHFTANVVSGAVYQIASPSLEVTFSLSAPATIFLVRKYIFSAGSVTSEGFISCRRTD